MAPGIMAMQPGVQSYVQAPISSGHPQMGPGRFQVPMTPGSYVPMTTVSAGQHGGRQRSFGATEPGSHMLGIALGAVAIGAVVGWKYAGPLGGLAGGLLGGAAVNGFRAAKSITHGTPDSDKEAAVSGTYAVAGAGAAIYLLYRATNTKASAFLKNGSDEPEEEDDEEDVEPNTEETADEADEDSDA